MKNIIVKSLLRNDIPLRISNRLKDGLHYERLYFFDDNIYFIDRKNIIAIHDEYVRASLIIDLKHKKFTFVHIKSLNKIRRRKELISEIKKHYENYKQI